MAFGGIWILDIPKASSPRAQTNRALLASASGRGVATPRLNAIHMLARKEPKKKKQEEKKRTKHTRSNQTTGNFGHDSSKFLRV